MTAPCCGYSRAIDAPPQEIRLTSLSHGAGCACKLGPDELGDLLSKLPRAEDPDLLVAADLRDDAAVYRLSNELAVISTADFFTPIVDDPYDFGRIAAANALSDVYAMGGEPIMAINLVAFSVRSLGVAPLEGILAGGLEIAREAGISIAGGHSIDDPEPKYGLAVTGVVHPDHVVTNAGARPGDALHLTKPLGAGLVTTAAKRSLASDDLIKHAVAVMTTLNLEASRAAVDLGARAMTDVTGFGLLGHLRELCEASGVGAEIDSGAVPAIDGVLELAQDERCIAGGTRRNAAYAQGFTRWDRGVDPARRILLADAMTSGGLLVAVPEGASAVALGVRIGTITDDVGRITVRAS